MLLAAWDSGFNGYAIPGSPSSQVPTTGYFVQAADLITGEPLRERTVIDPIRRFDPRKGQFSLGAWEPYAHFSTMTLGN